MLVAPIVWRDVRRDKDLLTKGRRIIQRCQSYEIAVDHGEKIIAATEGHPRCRNDKTIVKFDGFVTAIHEGGIYSEVPYSIVNEDGVVRTEKGLYLIVDGGYHK